MAWNILGAFRARESELAIRARSLADPTFVIDGGSKIIEANEAAARAFSWPSGMFKTMDVRFFVDGALDTGMPGSDSDSGIFADGADTSQPLIVIANALNGRKFKAELQVSAADDSRDDHRTVTFRELDWHDKLARSSRAALN